MDKKKIKVIRNGQVVLENGILWDGAIVIEDNRIVQVGPEREIPIPTGAQIIDAGGAYVGPGFVDIHVHGGGGFCTCFEAEQAADFFLSHGETTLLSTAIYTWGIDELLEGIRAAKEASRTAKNIRGMYMETPYINPQYGCAADQNQWGGPILPQDYKRFVDEAGEFAKVWVIAPEREGLMPFLEYARQVNPQVVFSVGHSEATPMQIRALGKYKPTLQTHCMNATGRKAVYGGTRSYGPDEYALKEDGMYTELISDSCGIHVHPEMQQLILHNKGVNRVVLVTDSTNFDGQCPENLRHIRDLNFDEHGGIAGSKMTMDLACKNIMTHTNCGIAQAFIMGALNPARAISMDDEIGSIAVGKLANLVIVDDRFAIRGVLLEGEQKY